MNKKSETALEWFFYGEEFELWKLQTKDDYLFFFGMIIFGIIVLWSVSAYFKSQRNQEKAKERVWRRLKNLAGKPQKLHTGISLRLPGGDIALDGVMMDKSGIYLIKVFGWGLKVFGTPDGDTWKLQDDKRTEVIENPLHDLRKATTELQELLKEKGIKRVKIQPVVIFADNYRTPELYLGYGSNSTTYQELKTWYQKQAGVKEAQYDFERVAAIMDNEVIKK